MPERNFQSDFEHFIEQFLRASQEIDHAYMQLPVAGKETPIYRERVYCYELYHQLSLLRVQFAPYSLSGEVDKSGHPYIRGNNLDCVKPDFLLHEPGNMDANLPIY